MNNQQKTCIKCENVKSCNSFINKWRPNICKPCLKVDAHDKYIKGRVTKDMCDNIVHEEKRKRLKDRRDKIRDDNGKYICLSCDKSVAIKYKDKHNLTKYHLNRLNPKQEQEQEQEQVQELELYPVMVQKRNKETNEIEETTEYMVTKDKRAQILEMLGR